MREFFRERVEEEEGEEEGGDDHSVIEMHLLFLISTCDIVVSVNI